MVESEPCPCCGAMPIDQTHNPSRIRDAIEGVLHFADAIAYRDDPLSVELRGWINELRNRMEEV